jgi:hypothetical protein
LSLTAEHREKSAAVLTSHNCLQLSQPIII